MFDDAQNIGESTGFGAVRSWKAVLVIFVLAFAVSSYVRFGAYGLPVNLVNLNWALGSALALVALPILVIVPWRFFQRHRRRITNNPIMIGSIVFVIVVVFFVRGVLYNIS